MEDAIQALDHVGIHVADVEVSAKFYADVLGLEVIPRPDLDFPGQWLRIGTAQELHLIGKNSDPTGRPPGERHFALEVRDADAWATRLGDHGVTFKGPNSRPDGAKQIFFRDPDGHVIELLEHAARPAGA